MEEILILLDYLRSVGVDEKIIGLISGLAYLGKKLYDVKRQENKKANYDIDKKTLLAHDFFTEMEYYIKYGIPRLNIKNPFKKKIAQDFLTFKFTHFCASINRFIKTDEYISSSKEEFHKKIHTLLVDGIEEYNTMCTDAGIPELYIDKFNQWHDNRVTTLVDSIKTISYSEHFTIDQKAHFILHQLLVGFHQTILDSEKALSEINGHLVGLEYKDLICKPDKDYE